jgi:glycosyltransferase 2 family protein
MTQSSLQRNILVSLLIGVVVLLAISLFSDAAAVAAALAAFSWPLLPLVLGFTALNYVLRWAKWDYYLRYLQLGANVTRTDSALLFTAGMVMAVTPGKLGEVLKSFLLKQRNGTPITRSAPIVLAERITDGLAMLLLMGFGLTLYPPARPLFVLLLLASLAGVLIIQRRSWALAVLGFIGRLPFGARIAPRLTTLYTTTAELLSWRILLVSTLLSVVSWGFECIAFYYVLLGFGVTGGWQLLLVATFVFAASTLFGLVSFLPGGLGASEVSSVGLLVALLQAPAAAATGATIVIRFATLWFGVLLGVLALLYLGRRNLGLPPAAQAAAAQEEA